MKSELCKKCIHTNVCMNDKNLFGDTFVPGHPMLFNNEELFKKYEERGKAGFPCNDYFPQIVRCKDCKESQSYGNTEFVVCHKHQSLCNIDWFCADGEKVTE